MDSFSFIARPGRSLVTATPTRYAAVLSILLVIASALPVPVALAANQPLHVGDVLVGTDSGVIKHFQPSGALVGTLNTTTNTVEAGMCVDHSLNLFATNFGSNLVINGGSVGKFDSDTNLIAARFAGPFQSPESCVFDQAGNVYVGEGVAGNGSIYKIDSSGHLVTTFQAKTETNGTDWIDLAADQCTLYYTSEGSSIKRFNVCTNTQLSDLVQNLTNCFALRIRPNGEVLVACASQVSVDSRVYRLSASGQVLQTYDPGGAAHLFGLSLDPDGTSFWTGDHKNGQVYHVAIASGTLLGQFSSNGGGGLNGLFVLGSDRLADRVIGQSTFTTSLCNRSTTTATPTAATLCMPHDTAIAPSGRLLVADTGNNRVLSWPNAASLTNGQAADVVLGQSSATGKLCNGTTTIGAPPTARTVCGPTGLAVDSSGAVYVADTGNGRTLKYASPLVTGMAASLVLGKPNFTSSGCPPPGATTLCRPSDVSVDSSMNVYVADTGANRVVRYPAPVSSGRAATLVFGQPSFTGGTANSGGLSARSLSGPTYLTLDSSGRLYVADSTNNRVLRYTAPFSDGMAATLVLGQSNFTTAACAATPSARSLCSPAGLALDSLGRLYTADKANRVLQFSTSLSNGVAARAVLGQLNFSAASCGVSIERLCAPAGIATRASNVYVVDETNNRLLEFDNPFP